MNIVHALTSVAIVAFIIAAMGLAGYVESMP